MLGICHAEKSVRVKGLTKGTIHAVEDTSCDQAREGCGKNVSSVQNRNASGNLLAVIEEGEDVDGTGVV